MRFVPGLILLLLAAAAAPARADKPAAGNAAAADNVIDSRPSLRAETAAAADAKPDATTADQAANAGVDRFTLPAWLTDGGLPVWAWPPLGLIALVMVRRLFGRGGDRPRDLLGPPPSMRPGARPAITPPPPRPAVPPSGPRA